MSLLKELQFSLLLTILVGGIFAQDLRINNIRFENNQVSIQYEILDTLLTRQYTVRAYSSRDNFLNPLKQVNGAIGHEIFPGAERTMIWDAQEELGADFDGSVAVELRARVYVPFIQIPWFDDVEVLKKKRTYSITWAGGRSGNVLHFDLYNSKKEKVATFANVANVGHYDLTIPADVKPGKGYRFKIRDSKNEDEIVFTEYFNIKRKVPLALLFIPVAAASTAAYSLINQSENTPGEIQDPIEPSIRNYHRR